MTGKETAGNLEVATRRALLAVAEEGMMLVLTMTARRKIQRLGVLVGKTAVVQSVIVTVWAVVEIMISPETDPSKAILVALALTDLTAQKGVSHFYFKILR